MTFEMRKERAQLYNDLTNVLTDCNDDAEYFRRLTWSLEFISARLSEYTDVVERGVFQSDLEEDDERDDRFPPNMFELNP